MKPILLPAGRLYNWRLFWWLMAINAPAAFALIPFALTLQQSFIEPDMDLERSVQILVADRIFTIALIALLGSIGLAIANRIGVGLPFLERRLAGEPAPGRFRGIVAIGLLVGLSCAAILLALSLGVFQQPMLTMFEQLGIDIPTETVAPPLYGFLAAIAAGVTEETTFRLFGLSLLAWLAGFLWRSRDGRPQPAAFWIANILLALVFGAAHLVTASAIGWPMNALVLTRTFTLNGIAGLGFGWLFWTYGLESAMLAHFFTDVGLYTLVPIVANQTEPGSRRIAIAAVALVVIVSVIWAVRTLLKERTPVGSEA